MGKKYGFGEGMSSAEGLSWLVRPPLLMLAKEAALRIGEAAAASSDSVCANGSCANAVPDLVGDANGLSGRLCSVLEEKQKMR